MVAAAAAVAAVVAVVVERLRKTHGEHILINKSQHKLNELLTTLVINAMIIHRPGLKMFEFWNCEPSEMKTVFVSIIPPIVPGSVEIERALIVGSVLSVGS